MNFPVFETPLDSEELLALLPGIPGELCKSAEQRSDLVHQNLPKRQRREQ